MVITKYYRPSDDDKNDESPVNKEGDSSFNELSSSVEKPVREPGLESLSKEDKQEEKK